MYICTCPTYYERSAFFCVRNIITARQPACLPFHLLWHCSFGCRHLPTENSNTQPCPCFWSIRFFQPNEQKIPAADVNFRFSVFVYAAGGCAADPRAGGTSCPRALFRTSTGPSRAFFITVEESNYTWPLSRKREKLCKWEAAKTGKVHQSDGCRGLRFSLSPNGTNTPLSVRPPFKSQKHFAICFPKIQLQSSWMLCNVE